MAITFTHTSQTVGTPTLTIPDFASVSDTFVFKTLAQELASKTMTAQIVKTGLTASGSASNDFSSSTGTFKTSTGANTLSGAVTVNDAATPSITLATGKTNTGFLIINGKTSGSTKFLTADATAQAVVINTAAQTTGGCTLTIVDQGGVSSSFVFTTLAQTLTNKTLTAPVLGVATGTSLAVTGLITSSSGTAGIGYATGAGGTVSQATDRTTGVTLNKITGQITTQATSLAAQTSVSFTVTNSAVALGDTIVLSIQSGPTGTKTIATVTTVAAGSFKINLFNTDASTADTGAAIINYCVLKGAAA